MKPLEDRLGEARAVLIAGPTASGKSAFVLRLAEDLAARGRRAMIVNADAMQVYADLRVLTARPGPAEEERATHRLYGHVDAATRYSVGGWLGDAGAVLSEAADTGAVPIVVGGTGLYFKTLTEGLAATPEVPLAVRRTLAAELAEHGAAQLHARLTERDPVAAAAIRSGDPQRILRALEVIEATGEPLSAWQAAAAPPLLPPRDILRLVLEPDRNLLYQRVEARFNAMVLQGASDEVAALLQRNLDPKLPAMKAIGVRAFAAFLRGESTLDDAMAAAKTETRRYAKRQLTWFRNQMRDWERLAV